MLLLHLYLSHIDFTAKSSFYRSHFDINGLKIDGNSVPSGQSLKAVTSVKIYLLYWENAYKLFCASIYENMPRKHFFMIL